MQCAGQATDCECRVDGLSCAETGDWYCRDVPPGGQIGVDGLPFGGAPPPGPRAVQPGCDARNFTVGKLLRSTATCKFVRPA